MHTEYSTLSACKCVLPEFVIKTIVASDSQVGVQVRAGADFLMRQIFANAVRCVFLVVWGCVMALRMGVTLRLHLSALYNSLQYLAFSRPAAAGEGYARPIGRIYGLMCVYARKWAAV